MAATVLRKVQDLYLEKHLKLHRPPGTYDFFKNQASQSEDQLRDAQKQLSTFQQSMNVVSLTQQKEQTVQKLTDAKSRLMETKATLRELNERIAKLEQQLRNDSSAHCDAKPRPAEPILSRASEHDDC